MTEEEFLTTAHEYGFHTRENGKYRQIYFYNLEDKWVLLAEWNPDKERDLWSRYDKDDHPIWYPAGMARAWSIIPQQDVNGVSYDIGTLSTDVRFSQVRKFKPWVEDQAERLKHIKKEIKKEEIKYTEFTL